MTSLALRRLAALWLVCLLPLAAPAQEAVRDPAQDPAMLIADRVFVDGDRLVAEGNVEAMQGERSLQASRISYDRGTARLEIEGPLRLRDGDNVQVLAESAALDRDLRNGILRGARMVLDEQLQLAAAQMNRVNGRYTQLARVAVTSCQVCGPEGVPLWQIRARRVVHDQQERQIYFDNAEFRVLDVPIFWLPRLRLPDPTLERARGFLIPSARSTTQLGFGLKLPYFVPIGDHQDITITPYLSPVTRTLELRYRRAFATGRLQAEGAVSRDTIRSGETRGYLFADGAFDLKNDFRLTFDVEATSDDSYLTEYGYSDKDRLDSEVILSRTRRDSYFEAGLRHFESLRQGENNATQPTIVGDAYYERRFFPRLAGGELRMSAAAHSHYRYSDLDIDGPDADSVVDGRDLSRLSTEVSWRRRWTLAGGLRAGVLTQVAGDLFYTDQDASRASDVAMLTPAAVVELRWPLVRREAGGASQILEPLVQIGWTGGDRPDVANDESTRVEWDEGNLLALSRFPAPDRRERGTVGVAGLRWERHDPSGWSAGVTVGQVLRASDDAAFTRSSGLSGTRSDLLIAGHLEAASGLKLLARGLLTESGEPSKAEARAVWINDRLDLSAAYLLLRADPAEDRPDSVSEWSLDGAYRIGRHWTTSANWRYDLVSDRTAKAGLGLEYRNECIEVDFSVSRRYTSSTTLEPSTDFGLTVSLKGFSTGGSAKEVRRTCTF
ncbi:LPS assembly protein LptD [Aquicoccus sp. SCR17]|nr:LPS assembly protein LptD [Carideicomes alvinocaridis]